MCSLFARYHSRSAGMMVEVVKPIPTSEDGLIIFLVKLHNFLHRKLV